MGHQIQGVRFLGGEYVQALNVTGTVIGLDLTSSAQRSSGTLNHGAFHIANTVFCHIKWGDSSVTADSTSALLAPGERTLVFPQGSYVSVVKASGQSDGIIRITEAV